MNVFLVPGSPENIERSIIDGVELNEMDIRDPSLKEKLAEHYGNEKIKLWALKESIQNRWALIEKGDYVLFYCRGRFTHVAKVSFKYPFKDEPDQVNNGRYLAESVWGRDVDGSTWPYLFFLEDVREINLPLSDFNRLTGYRLNAVAGFMRMRSGTSAIIDYIKKIYAKPSTTPEVEAIKPEPTSELRRILEIHLLSGKNVIIFGPPGVGKTETAKSLAEGLASGYDFALGNPDWTTYDVIGGYKVLSDEFKLGFFSRCVVRCWRSLRRGKGPVWLILDEINRANMDLAFGNAFALLDITHRGDVPLLTEDEVENVAGLEDVTINGALFVPYSFRIISTMNSYDRALLHKLGFALLRRFAVVPMWSKPYTLETNNDIFLKTVREFEEPNVVEIDERWIVNQLSLARENFNDYALITPERRDSLISSYEVFSEKISTLTGMGIVELVEAIRQTINRMLDNTGVEITMALSLDATKFLVASYLALGDETVNFLRGLLDEAVAAYMLPQLDVLSDKIRAERLGIGGEKAITRKVEDIKKFLRQLSLTSRTIPMLDRLLRGEHVI